MGKYLLKRILYSIFSVVCIMIVMVFLLFTLKDSSEVLVKDTTYLKLKSNYRTHYGDSILEKYDYFDMVDFSDYMSQHYLDKLSLEEYQSAVTVPDTQAAGEESEYILEFEEYYKSRKYEICYLEAEYNSKGTLVDGGEAYLYAKKNNNTFVRVWKFFSSMFSFETTHDVADACTEQGLDPENGYYVITSSNGMEDFDNYWSFSNCQLTQNKLKTKNYGKGIVYSFEFSVSEEQIQAAGNEYHVNVCLYHNGDKDTSDFGEDYLIVPAHTETIDGEETTVSGPGTYQVLAYINNDGTYSKTITQKSEDVDTTELLTEGTVYPIEKTGIELIWDEYSHMPALVGYGTEHKYLIYFDNVFPYIHQNILHINFGKSYVGTTANNGVVEILTEKQGEVTSYEQVYPAQLGTDAEPVLTSENFHTATYNYSTIFRSDVLLPQFGDRYTVCSSYTNKLSRIGYSFILGIIATVIAYFVGIPLGILMARRKEKLADKLGMAYIIFIIAVPSLAYIYIFKAIGTGWFKLPSTFSSASNPQWLVYILPIISLALPSIAGEMRWVRRYMIDQANSDYVKFARSQGLSEGEIFTKHIAKNAIIPIVHGMPGAIIGCISGAFITENVYGVPGSGKLLITAINNSDNGLILGLTFLFSILSIISLILGDIMLTIVDPRISFTKGGR